MVEIEKSISDTVDYYEHPVHTAERTLRAKGYGIESPIVRQGETYYMRILKRRDPVRFFFGLLKENQPDYCVGRLTVKTESSRLSAEERKDLRDDHPDSLVEKWYLDVYGDKFVEELAKTAEELAREHNVELEVRLRGVLNKEDKIRNKFS